MGYSIPIVGQHEYLLELVTCTDLQFEDTLLGPDCDILEMVYSIPDCKSRRVLVNTTNFIPLAHYILSQPVDSLN